MRFAYADPPYLGCGKAHYAEHPDAGDFDKLETHAALIARLVAEYPDGWALSLTSSSLRALLPLCPERARVGAWVKPFASFKRGVKVAYAWEPIIWCGGRKIHIDDRTRRDWVSAMPPVFVNQGGTPGQPSGTKGKKPDAFCFWLFDALNIEDEDELVDMFPGSGAITRALDQYRRQRRFA